MFICFSQCNVPCGDGSQRRDIICVKKLGNDFTVTSDAACAHLEKPAAVQECQMGECQPQWFTTEWSAVRETGNDQNSAARCSPLRLSSALLFSVFTFVWEGLTGERSPMSDT